MKNIKTYLILHICIFMVSVGGVFAKKAAAEEFLSGNYIIFYGITLLINIIFILIWQQIIKTIPLNSASASKAATIIWNAILGVCIFHETLSINNIIGFILVGTGVILITIGGKNKNE